MFRERKEMHIYMLKNSIFLTIKSEKTPLEISYFLGLKNYIQWNWKPISGSINVFS